MTSSAGPMGLELAFAHDPAAAHAEPRSIRSILEAVRTHLDMDVAFVAEFAKGRRAFRHVVARSGDGPMAAGDSDPLDETYCQRVIEGRLPSLIRNALEHDEARGLAVTASLPVGAHLSVPIRLSDGRCFGTFCCFSHTPDYSLNQRDLKVMRVFAALAAERIEEQLEAEREHDEVRHRVLAVLDDGLLSSVYQPVICVERCRVIGFEALSRIGAEPLRAPDRWFIDAERAGLGVPFETLALRRALRGLAHLPDELFLTLNVSPNMLLHGDMEDVLGDSPLERIVLEVTEHSIIEHYHELARAIDPLRSRGLRLAVDDAGAGYASFKHVLSLAPDLIKLDNSITRGIDSHRARYALAAALVRFAEETGGDIVAEGVETDAEFTALRRLGIAHAQGYLLGRPLPIEQAVRLAGVQLAT